MTTTDRAIRYRSRINANVDDFHAKRIDYETFSARARALWDTIRRAGYGAAVMSEIRVAMYGEGSR